MKILHPDLLGFHPDSPVPSYASPRYATDLGYLIVHRPLFAMAALLLEIQ